MGIVDVLGSDDRVAAPALVLMTRLAVFPVLSGVSRLGRPICPGFLLQFRSVRPSRTATAQGTVPGLPVNIRIPETHAALVAGARLTTSGSV